MPDLQTATAPHANGNNISIAGVSLELPVLDARANAAKAAIAHHKDYANTIDCAEAHQFVAEELTSVKSLLKAASAERDTQKKPFQTIRAIALQAMDRVDNQFGPLIQYLQTSEALLKGEVTRWLLLEESRLRREQEEETTKRAEIARGLAEEARKRQDAARVAAAEKQRQAADALRAGETDRAAQLTVEANVQAATADSEAQEGLEEAEAVLTTPIVATKHRTNTVKGQSLSHSREAELVDMNAALQAVIDGKIPMTTIDKGKEVNIVGFNMKWFHSEAIRLGDHFNYPGFKSKPKHGLNVKA